MASDALGVSGKARLRALAAGETDAELFDLGLRRLGSYMALESLLVAAVAAGLAYAGGLL